eukprot:GHVR01132317.1.p1 GENE.GHVR01132317.1~~GHVR01132317.1.p1  ORF type:complete len:319 (-),score=76.39 GHVR01132317.1:116-1072(-)
MMSADTNKHTAKAGTGFVKCDASMQDEVKSEFGYQKNKCACVSVVVLVVFVLLLVAVLISLIIYMFTSLIRLQHVPIDPHIPMDGLFDGGNITIALLETVPISSFNMMHTLSIQTGETVLSNFRIDAVHRELNTATTLDLSTRQILTVSHGKHRATLTDKNGREILEYIWSVEADDERVLIRSLIDEKPVEKPDVSSPFSDGTHTHTHTDTETDTGESKTETDTGESKTETDTQSETDTPGGENLLGGLRRLDAFGILNRHKHNSNTRYGHIVGREYSCAHFPCLGMIGLAYPYTNRPYPMYGYAMGTPYHGWPTMRR